ncbi:MAG: tol-pal system protein YbgF [Thermodesulfobacteriota bacterium]
MPIGEQGSIQKDVHYLMAVNEGLRKKVAELQRNSARVSKDVQNLEAGLSSIVDETHSFMAESNSDIDRFKEEFGYVRGGAEETSVVRQRFRDDIRALRREQELSSKKTAEIKKATLNLEKNSNLSDDELMNAINKLAEMVTSLEDELSILQKKSRDLDERVIYLEPTKEERKNIEAIEKDPKQLYIIGYHYAMDKQFTLALDNLKRFLAAFPDHKLSDNAQYWVGETYYGMGDYERAIVEFNKVVKRYPKGDKVAAAYLKQGYSFHKLGSDDEAKMLFERVIDKFPTSSEAKDAKKRIKKIELLKQGSKKKTP